MNRRPLCEFLKISIQSLLIVTRWIAIDLISWGIAALNTLLIIQLRLLCVKRKYITVHVLFILFVQCLVSAFFYIVVNYLFNNNTRQTSQPTAGNLKKTQYGFCTIKLNRTRLQLWTVTFLLRIPCVSRNWGSSKFTCSFHIDPVWFN